MGAAPGKRLLFFGLRKGCEAQRDLDAQVRDHLIGAGETLLSCEGHERRPVLMGPDPSCSGPECVRRLPQGCLGVPLRAVGGDIYEQGPHTVVRLWVTETAGPDSATWSAAFADSFCSSCGGEALAAHITKSLSELLERPARLSLSQPWPTRPTFCPAVLASGEAVPKKILLFDARTSTSRREQTVMAAVREQLKLVGEDYLSLQQVAGRKNACSSLECLTSLVDAHRARGVGRVLGVTEESQSRLVLWLFDGVTKRTLQEAVECDDCDERRLRELAATKVPRLAQSCFDEACENARRATSAPAPTEACRSMDVPQCTAGGALWKQGPYRLVAWNVASPGGVDLQPAGPTPAPQLSLPLRSPRPISHQWTEGLLWGATAAGLVATTVLGIANTTTSCTIAFPRDGGGTQPVSFSNCLRDQTIAVGAFTGLSFMIALPVTILLERERPRSRPATEPAASSGP